MITRDMGLPLRAFLVASIALQLVLVKTMPAAANAKIGAAYSFAGMQPT